MADQLQIQNETAILTTDEGLQIEQPASDLVEMFRRERVPPLNGTALPDGVKFVEWQDPFLVVVHQIPSQVRRLRWIHDDSPAEYGPETVYRNVRLSVPYSITFAMYFYRGGQLFLTDANELYFRNSPLVLKDDRLGYPVLLNISRVSGENRERAWICTQHLRRTPEMSWTQQLTALVDHSWNGGFNRSSEHHEGASWYKYSEGVDSELHPIERWEAATTKSEAFGVSVQWKQAGLSVGEIIERIFSEQRSGAYAVMRRRLPKLKSAGIVTRFINFAQKCPEKTTAKKPKTEKKPKPVKKSKP